MTGHLEVIAHEGYRNGASVVLHHLLPPVIAALELPTRVVVQTEGPLAGPLRSLSNAPRTESAPALVLVNSALAAHALMAMDPAAPSVAWVHEQGEALQRLPPAAVEGLTQRADRVLCVSERARTDLERLGVDPARLVRIPPPIVDPDVQPDAVADVRRVLAPDPGRRLVLACGEATWRKGADLFVALAAATADPRVSFAWLGRRSRAFAKQLDHDTALAGLADRLTWLGEVEDPAAHLAAADLLVLTSREDPQPLVPLEAAMVGTATVGFAGTGLDDLVDVGGARSAPYPDARALSMLLTEALDDPEGRRAVVEGARRLVREQRSLDRIATLVVEELRTALAAAPDDRPIPSEHS